MFRSFMFTSSAVERPPCQKYTGLLRDTVDNCGDTNWRPLASLRFSLCHHSRGPWLRPPQFEVETVLLFVYLVESRSILKQVDGGSDSYTALNWLKMHFKGQFWRFLGSQY